MALSLAIIGWGAIGQWAGRRLAAEPDVDLRYVVVRQGRQSSVSVPGDARLVTSVDDIADASLPDVVVEAAGHAALAEHGAAALRRGVDLIVTSIGAFSDPELAASLEAAAKQGGARIELIPGAIGAVDAIAAAKAGGLDRVVYTSRKPPAAWKDTPAEKALDLSRVDKPAVHFEGSAREAARLYPKNANVAATVALAGLGLDETTVTLVADPTVGGNVHEISAEGAFGRFAISIEGRPLPDNPKTSSLTAMSVVRAVLNRARPVAI